MRTSLNNGLKPLRKVLNFSAYLIANRTSWQKKDLSEIMATLENVQFEEKEPLQVTNSTPSIQFVPQVIDKDTVRLALPDGHQQKHTVQLLNKAGIQIDDYPSTTGNRRPTSNLEGVVIKVIRPQDMPLQVANDNFDLAITGIDWVTDHLDLFPSSPVQALLDLKLGWVKIVAVVSNDVPVNNIYDYQQPAAKISPLSGLPRNMLILPISMRGTIVWKCTAFYRHGAQPKHFCRKMPTC